MSARRLSLEAEAEGAKRVCSRAPSDTGREVAHPLPGSPQPPQVYDPTNASTLHGSSRGRSGPVQARQGAPPPHPTTPLTFGLGYVGPHVGIGTSGCAGSASSGQLTISSPAASATQILPLTYNYSAQGHLASAQEVAAAVPVQAPSFGCQLLQHQLQHQPVTLPGAAIPAATPAAAEPCLPVTRPSPPPLPRLPSLPPLPVDPSCEQQQQHQHQHQHHQGEHHQDPFALMPVPSSSMDTSLLDNNMRPYADLEKVVAIAEELGAGGFCKVWRGTIKGTGEEVAVRGLYQQKHVPENRQAFIREHDMLQRLDHPNILKPRPELYLDSEDIAVLCELAIGDALDVALAGGNKGNPALIPWRLDSISKIVNFLECVGGAVAYIHKLGLIHRDIKPQNLLVMVDGQYKLADLGLARYLDTSGRATTNAGTNLFKAPEIGSVAYDDRVDVWSFALTVYELITGLKSEPIRGYAMTTNPDDVAKLRNRLCHDIGAAIDKWPPQQQPMGPDRELFVTRLVAFISTGLTYIHVHRPPMATLLHGSALLHAPFSQADFDKATPRALYSAWKRLNEANSKYSSTSVMIQALTAGGRLEAMGLDDERVDTVCKRLWKNRKPVVGMRKAMTTDQVDRALLALAAVLGDQ